MATDEGQADIQIIWIVAAGLPIRCLAETAALSNLRHQAVLSAPQRGYRTPQSTAMRSTGQDKIITPELSSGRGSEVRQGEEEEYETSFTSQSVQPKPGAGTDRQPASDTLNTGLLQLPIRRYHLSRRGPVE
jgi:hypothetical protein